MIKTAGQHQDDAIADALDEWELKRLKDRIRTRSYHIVVKSDQKRTIQDIINWLTK